MNNVKFYADNNSPFPPLNYGCIVPPQQVVKEIRKGSATANGRRNGGVNVGTAVGSRKKSNPHFPPIPKSHSHILLGIHNNLLHQGDK